MNKQRVVIGLVVLVLLAVVAVGVLRPEAIGLAQLKSPLATPVPRMTAEPTAPSEDWPTLGPPYTWPPLPTPQGTPVVKYTEPLPPTPTPLPSLSLPPIPEGEPPSELWSILYLPLDDPLAVYGVLVDRQGRRWSDPQTVYDFRELGLGPDTSLTQLDVSPTGDWLAVAVAYLESNQIWLFHLASQESHAVPACDEYRACGVHDWSPDGKSLILQRFPHTMSPPDDFVVVEVARDTMIGLPVPETALAHPSVQEVAFSPDGRSVAWIVVEQSKDMTTEIWLSDTSGDHARLLVSERGWAGNLTWHPDGSLVAYSVDVGGYKYRVRFLSTPTGKDVLSASLSPKGYGSAWSPNGFQVAMGRCDDASEETGPSDRRCSMAVFDTDTAEDVAVVEAWRGSWGGSWSPDGSLMAFVSSDTEALQAVWLYALEAGESYPVSGYMRPYSRYAWLPYDFTAEQKGE
ncbi:MAG: WD40 repeat domain-containing protein [Anaerolineae bacterium]|nr:WD40 repeat domain-containing protein [Anaerolineae bacterium]